MSQDDILKKLDELSQKIDTLETSLNHRSHPSLFLKMDVKDLHLQELNLIRISPRQHRNKGSERDAEYGKCLLPIYPSETEKTASPKEKKENR